MSQKEETENWGANRRELNLTAELQPGETIDLPSDPKRAEVTVELSQDDDERTTEFDSANLPDNDMTLDMPNQADRLAGRQGPHGHPRVAAAKPNLESTEREDEFSGKVVGDYVLSRELGRGGMGIVYKAQHRKLKRQAAIKMILAGSSSRQDVRNRFEVEARAVAALQHPNVVQLFEFGEVDGNPYFALEYVDGGTLSDSVSAQPLEPKHAAELVETLARAMQVAHRKGILHRDLKPSNILVSSAGIPKISDFGLAKQLVDDDQETRTGTIMGTPSYMSPEQARGETNSLTPATDQYSLGAILYACLTSRPPFMSASAIDTISQVVHNDPVPLRQLSNSIPADLETICLKTLQKDPAKRYADCTELADDLRRFCNGEPIRARPVSRLEKVVRWCRRNPSVAIPSGLAAGLILAVALISSWAWSATAAQAAVIAHERDNVKEQRDAANEATILATAAAKRASDATILANERKAFAEKQEQLAKKQALLALESMQFVLTKVDTELKKLPGVSEIRLEVLQALSKKWDELDIELTGGLRSEAMSTRMDIRFRIGDVLEELGRFAEADREYTSLVELAKQRIALMGRNRLTIGNLASALLKKAGTARKLTDNSKATIDLLTQAEALYQEIIDQHLPEELAQQRGAYTEFAAVKQNLATAYLSLSHIRQAQEQFAGSYAAHIQAVETFQLEPGFDQLSQAKQATKSYRYQAEVDRAGMGLAYVSLRLGDTDQCIEVYEKAIASQRKFANMLPKVLSLKSDLADSLKLYGKCLIWGDRWDKADSVLREAVQLNQEVFEADPQKVYYKSGLADACYFLATLRDLQGHADEALSLFERSRLLRKELYDTSPDSKSSRNLMLSEARVGNADAASELIAKLGEQEEADGDLHLDRARALAQLARAEQDSDRSKAWIDQSLTALELAVEKGFTEVYRIEAEDDLEPIRKERRYLDLVEALAK